MNDNTDTIRTVQKAHSHRGGTARTAGRNGAKAEAADGAEIAGRTGMLLFLILCCVPVEAGVTKHCGKSLGRAGPIRSLRTEGRLGGQVGLVPLSVGQRDWA